MLPGPVGFSQPLTVASVEVRANELLRPADPLAITAEGYPSVELCPRSPSPGHFTLEP